MSISYRILHLIYDDIDNPWLGGGGALRTKEVYRRFTPDWQITVVTGSYPGAKSYKEGNISYLRVGSNRNYFLSRVSYTYEARKLVQQEEYDLLVEDFSPYSPCLAARYTSKPAVAVIQNIFGIHATRHLGPLGLVAMVAERQMFSLYQNFVTVSETINRRTRAFASANAQIAFIPCGVDDYLFEPYETQEEPFILFLGRIDIYQKGLDILLSAFAELAPKYPWLELYIAGSGKDEKKLNRLIKSKPQVANRIRILGRVVGLPKRELIRHSILVCVPSRFESWGLVAIEANACGKSVVGSHIPGLNEAVRHGETAFLVPPENPHFLATALVQLIAAPELRRKLGENGRTWAMRFTWQKTAETQQIFFQELIKTSNLSKINL